MTCAFHVRPSSEPILPKELKGRRPAALRLSGAAGPPDHVTCNVTCVLLGGMCRRPTALRLSGAARAQEHVTRGACYFWVASWHALF
jgi:hypothetical protein